MTTPSEPALLECALNAVEQVLARSSAGMAGITVSTPAHEALNVCLGSAAALIDVGRTLLRCEHGDSTEQLAHEWQALIAHTRMASRTAHQAALILAAQRNIVAAQQGVTLKGGDGANPTAA